MEGSASSRGATVPTAVKMQGGGTMAPHVSVLLVYHESVPMESLGRSLNTMSLSAGRARTCQEARHLIEATEPHVIFTDAKLPDGTWAEVVRSAEAAKTPSSVVVVSGTSDIQFYIKAMENGA